jgi:putative transposase
MGEQQCLVKAHRKLKAKRAVYPSKPKASRPNQIWGTDMTKVKLPHIGWAYIVLVLDWHSKKVVGHSIALRSKTEDWLDALHLACQQQFPQGIRSYQTVSLVSDNGCQPTSTRYMHACATLGIEQIFTSFCNPKGNADTERVIRTMKEELIWSHDWMSYEALSKALYRWVHEYNTQYLHSSLGYLPPSVFEKQKLNQQDKSPLMIA